MARFVDNERARASRAYVDSQEVHIHCRFALNAKNECYWGSVIRSV
jgi:hypothetical protein